MSGAEHDSNLDEPEETPVPGRRRLILMRHGEVRYVGDDGKPVHPKHAVLTPRGLAQAEAAGALLADAPLDLVVASSKERSQRTAEIVARHHGLPIRVEHDLTEIRSGRVLEFSRERFDRDFVYGFDGADKPGARFADGEPFAAFADRVLGVVRRLLAEDGWRCALIVSHEGVNRFLLSWAVGAGLAGAGAFDQDMGCLNVIDVDVADGAVRRTTLRAVNVTPSDPLKLRRHLFSMERLGRDLAPHCTGTGS